MAGKRGQMRLDREWKADDVFVSGQLTCSETNTYPRQKRFWHVGTLFVRGKA